MIKLDDEHAYIVHGNAHTHTYNIFETSGIGTLRPILACSNLRSNSPSSLILATG